MKPSRLAVVGAVFFACVNTAMGFAATSFDRDFTFSPDQLSITRDGAIAHVRAAGETREFRAGRPDLPWVAREIELPVGTRVVSVEVLELETEPMASGVSLRAAVRPTPGFEGIHRTEPDPQYFEASSWTPELPVEVGLQGARRGVNVAGLQIAPVRWNPTTRNLERVTRLRVRLHLDDGGVVPLKRERIVAEWDGPGRPGAVRMEATKVPGVRREAAPFVPTQLPSLLGSPVEYLIITNDEQAPEYQRLADWKTSKGVPAVVRTLSFIQQEYPFGADDAERIRLFIRDAYSRWGTKWVLLGGDTPVIPTRLAYTTFYGGENIATDQYFSCLDGDWNADADSIFGEGFFSSLNPGDDVDLWPEVYVGRGPTNTVAEAKHFVDRTMQYVREPVSGYHDNVLFFAEVLFPQNWSSGMSTSLDGAELAEEVLPHLQYNPSVHYSRLYENHLDVRWEPGAIEEFKSRVVDSLNVGYNISVHIGHGFRNVMSCGDANLDNSDAFSLSNGNKLTHLYAINCTSNAIDFPCIGEAFLLAQNGGAVTNTGSTRFDFPTAGRAYQKEWFRLLYEDSVTAVGELQAVQKVPFIAFATFDGVHRWTQMTLLLLGDPEMPIYTGDPRTLAVSHPGTVAQDDTSFSVNVQVGGSVLLGARVTAFKAGEEWSSVLTDGAGNATIPFRPDSVGDFSLVVTAFDCEPYEATMSVTPAGNPVFAKGDITIDDDNVSGTSGDSDGFIDAGETVDVMVPLTNTGGGSATAVSVTLRTVDTDVTLVDSVATYGTIGVSATESPASGFRLQVPASVEDQREIPFVLSILDGNGGHHIEEMELVVRAGEPFHLGHDVVDTGGNSDGRPDPGENVSYSVTLRNLGTGDAHGVSGVLRSYDGLVTISDSTSSFGSLAPGAEATGDPFEFIPSVDSATVELRLTQANGTLTVQTIDIVYPATPTTLQGVGAATSIALDWARTLDPDLRGYNVYRSLSPAGPFAKVNPVPTFRTAYYLDTDLDALTRYYYQITSVDSSGNESDTSSVAAISTNPPAHTVFPIPMVGNTPSSIAVDHVYSGYPVALVVGATKLHVYHPDGTSPVDADGAGTTFGDFSILGQYFAAGPSIGDVDDDGSVEIIAPTWDSKELFVFDDQGNVEAGWPLSVADAVWASAALDDLDNNGDLEIITSTNGSDLIGMHHDGTEIIDGDSNGGTLGIFKKLGGGFNPGTPALADIDGNNQVDIIHAGSAGDLNAWRPDGTSLPGFPVSLGGAVYSSVAVGYLDGPGDTELDIVVAVNDDSLHAFTAAGVQRPGFPVHIELSDVFKTPSPALADMNNDGFLDIVQASTDGIINVYDRNGAIVAPLSNLQYSPLSVGSSESSPVVADIDGDGFNDIVMGDETASVSAFSGATGTLLPGFPIVVAAEVRGTMALCDCDGDGMSEIVGAGWGGNVYMWDYDFPFQPSGAPPWPQFHHDARRTGLASSLAFVDVEGPGAASVPGTLEFAPPSPNPTRSSTQVRFSVPFELAGSFYEVAVYDLSGRRVQTLDSGVAKSGQSTVRWDLRNTRGSVVDAGVYFVNVSMGGQSLSRKLIVMR